MEDAVWSIVQQAKTELKAGHKSGSPNVGGRLSRRKRKE